LTFTDALPRLGVGWQEDGWQVAAGLGLYAAPLAAGEAFLENPLSREASLTYYWRDLDGDRSVDRGELDELFGRAGASNIDPEAAGSARSAHLVDPEVRAPRTTLAWGALTRPLGARGSAALTVQWRRLREPLWRPLRGLTLADYVARGTVEGTLFDDAYAVVYYAPASLSRIVPGHGRLLTNRRGYRQDAVSIDVQGHERLGSVELRAWAAFGEWRERFLDRSLAIQDPTPTDAEPLRDGGPVAPRPGGFGRGDVFVNARFSGGLSVSAPLPFGLHADARAWAREGFPVPYIEVANTGDPTAGSKPVLVSPTLTAHRLPAVVLLDAGLRRAVELGAGQLTISLDLFNALNARTPLQAERDVEATALGRARELMRPRIARLGLVYSF
jgi:hypothetical protein